MEEVEYWDEAFDAQELVTAYDAFTDAHGDEIAYGSENAVVCGDVVIADDGDDDDAFTLSNDGGETTVGSHHYETGTLGEMVEEARSNTSSVEVDGLTFNPSHLERALELAEDDNGWVCKNEGGIGEVGDVLVVGDGCRDHDCYAYDTTNGGRTGLISLPHFREKIDEAREGGPEYEIITNIGVDEGTTYLKFSTDNGRWGAIIPVTAEYELEEDMGGYTLHCNPDDDVSNMDFADGEKDNVFVTNVEVVGGSELL